MDMHELNRVIEWLDEILTCDQYSSLDPTERALTIIQLRMSLSDVQNLHDYLSELRRKSADGYTMSMA